MNLKTLPTEGSQTQKGTHIVHFHLYEISRNDKFVETEADWWLPGSEGEREQQVNCLVGMGFSLEVRKLF